MAGARQLATVAGQDRAQEFAERAGPVLRAVESAVRAQGLDEALAARCELPLGLSDCIEPPSISFLLRYTLVSLCHTCTQFTVFAARSLSLRQRLIHGNTCSMDSALIGAESAE